MQIADNTKWMFIAVFCAVLSCLALFSINMSWFVTKEGNVNATIMTENVICTVVQRWATSHGRLPKKLAELDVKHGGELNLENCCDAWGHPLTYIAYSNGDFEILSAGPGRASGCDNEIIKHKVLHGDWLQSTTPEGTTTPSATPDQPSR